MKQMKRLLIAALLLVSMATAYAESPKREIRSAWVTTAWNNDWPSSMSLSADAQKTELRNIIDQLHAANFNAVFLQVRSFCDAFYQSSYEPWSYYLTGTRGKASSYDPLHYAIEYAHSKGMELHAWINPYRYSSSKYNYGTLATDYATMHPDWIMHSSKDANATILNPGIPAVREQIAKVIAEIVTNYDIDGVLFDDYFYPNGATKDAEDETYFKQNNPKGLSRADWRRDQVNQMVELVYTTIKDIKPHVRFGISPAGVACTSQTVANKYGVDKCTVNSSDWQYDGIYSDPLAWISSHNLDYISPQIYWKIGAAADYDKLSKWWSNVANKFGRHFYSSHTLSKLDDWGDNEYVNQVALNRQYTKDDAPGSIFYNISNALESTTFLSHIKTNSFGSPSLPPAMSWETATTLAAPTNLKLSGTTFSWTHTTAPRFTVYAYPKGTNKTTALSSSEYLLGVSYTNSFDISAVGNLANTTLAVCAYDRYGNEYEAALYNAATSGQDNPNPSTPDLTFGSLKFYLQGGSLAVPADNEALWNAMWKEFKAAYSMINYTASGFVTPVLSQTGTGWSSSGGAGNEESIARFLQNCFYATENYTDVKYAAIEEAGAAWPWLEGEIWEWLGDYFYAVSPTYAGAILNFCYDTQGFLQQKDGLATYSLIDWSDNGLPSAWQPAYVFGHKPTKAGDTFLGWFDNAAGNGSAFTTLPTSGDVYACWKSNTSTAVETVENTSTIYLIPTFTGVEVLFDGTKQVTIYNINGIQVASGTATDYYACDLPSGMYIIRVGEEVHKFVR